MAVISPVHNYVQASAVEFLKLLTVSPTSFSAQKIGACCWYEGDLSISVTNVQELPAPSLVHFTFSSCGCHFFKSILNLSCISFLLSVPTGNYSFKSKIKNHIQVRLSLQTRDGEQFCRFSQCVVLLALVERNSVGEKCAVANCSCPGIVDVCDSSPDLSAPSIQGELPLAGMQLGAGCGFLFHCSHSLPQSVCSEAGMRISTNSALGNITKCDSTLTEASSGQRGERTAP